MHFDSRSIGCFAGPYVKILPFSSLEKKYIVAVVEFRQLIQLVELRLGIQFCIFAAVRKERVEVIQEMAMSVGNASGTEY